jgi:FMN phosphatase YigB (HAD superfamily)
MTFSLLFDLDDTLLDTNLDAFLSAYFKKLAGHMAKWVPPDQFINALLRSTQIMYNSKSTSATLEEVFGENFYPELGLPQEKLADEIDLFYDEIFPTLQSLTKARPEAVAMVEWAFSQGWNVAIATDPLFPRKAILHRLRWAGLAPEKYPFKLISDYQSFHFAKASVSYYPEFLAQMGWTEDPLLMVGDSMERDVLPSQLAGVPVFLLNNGSPSADASVNQGSFADLRRLLEAGDLTRFRPDYSAPSALAAFLQATPAVLHTLTRALPPSRWVQHPQPGEWSALEILCHLRDIDLEINLARVESILVEENAFIAGQSTDEWVTERAYNLSDPGQAFRTFVAAREKLVKLLAGLSAPDWERRARHTILGPTTLRELVEIMVDHDRLHIQQAAAALQ